ncbi:MAG: Ig domain-containing protein [Nitrospiria bacterium]
MRRIFFCLILLLSLPACENKTPGQEVKPPENLLGQNLPPSGSNVEKKLVLSPSPPVSENDLVAVVEGGQNPNGRLVYEWERNGMVIPFEKSSILNKSQFKRGDTVKATLLVNGGSERLISEPVKIENSPPKITLARIEPAQPTKRDTLSVKVESFDFDGDSVTYTYRWFKDDGTAIGNEAVISAALFSKGEKVNVEVIPSDGQSPGKGVIAGSTLTNAVPKITSTPSPFSGKEYTYQMTAEDPDKDPLTFSLLKAPPRMTIDPKTGVIKWAFTEKDAGTYPVEIKVSDPEGAESTQSFELPLSFTTSSAVSSTFSSTVDGNPIGK